MFHCIEACCNNLIGINHRNAGRGKDARCKTDKKPGSSQNTDADFKINAVER